MAYSLQLIAYSLDNMSLENIVDKILEDASAKREALVKDASSRADETLRSAQKDAAGLRKKIIDEANRRAELDMERAYIAKNLDIRKDILRKKRELIDRVFDGALESIFKLNDNKYLDILEKMILANVPRESCEIQFSKNDSARIKSDFLDKLNGKGFRLRMGPSFDRKDLGFVIKMDRIIMDFTFSKGLKALKDKFQFEVAKILFG
ncbi:MAG: V-type ATP synthase subunit E [Candidatus Omnitrophica bacterium]|nr:V-type ATP synthase subunit E [Candidatus Omnitrophota bacterium]